MSIITLTTDFGLSDGYVAAMKGVIIGLAPSVTLVDITHDVEPQNVRQAAMILASAAPHFPVETIHVAVVDPGVGTSRAILAVEAAGQIFLTPDNGLLSLIFERDPQAKSRRVENRALFRTEVSRTFHGRDIFAPVAAHLVSGAVLEDVGPETKDYVRNLIPPPAIDGRSIKGQIIYRDRFGNLITNITAAHLDGVHFTSAKVRSGELRLVGIYATYGEVEKDKTLCLIGSSGYLEIAVREGDAGKLFSLVVGGMVEVSDA